MDEQVSIRMTEQDAKKLRLLARKMGVSASEVIRELVRAAELTPQQRTVYTISATSVSQNAGQR